VIVMLFAFVPTALPASVTLPDETIVQDPPYFHDRGIGDGQRATMSLLVKKRPPRRRSHRRCY